MSYLIKPLLGEIQKVDTLTEEQQQHLDDLHPAMKRVPVDRLYYSDFFQCWRELPPSFASELQKKGKTQ